MPKPKTVRVPRTHAGGQWTKARYFSFIRGLLRGGFTRYPVKHQVKKQASRKMKGGRRFEYHCSLCKKWFPNSQVEVDHIIPAGSLRSYEDLAGFVSRLYCEPENLQVVCKTCHQKKTNEERKA
jgi:5-methylcytosine-specific restriction endonuclease McrA